jgi:hypothetical protein
MRAGVRAYIHATALDIAKAYLEDSVCLYRIESDLGQLAIASDLPPICGAAGAGPEG